MSDTQKNQGRLLKFAS